MATASGNPMLVRHLGLWLGGILLAAASAWVGQTLNLKSMAALLVVAGFLTAVAWRIEYGLAAFLFLLCVLPSRYNQEYLAWGPVYFNVYDPFLAALLVGWLVHMAVRREKWAMAKDISWVLGVMCLVAISAQWSAAEYQDPWKMMAGVLDWLHLFLFFIMAHHVLGTRDPRPVFYAVMAGSVVVALYGIYSYFFVKADYALPGTAVKAFSFEKRNVVGSMIGGGATTLGGFLALTAPLVFALFLTTRNWLLKLGFLAGFAIQVFMSVLTFSRGGWLGLSGALGMTIALVSRKPLRLVVGLAIFVFALVGGWRFMPRDVHMRFQTIFQPRNAVNIERLAIWKQARSYIAASPLLGTGPNNKYNTAIPYCMAKHRAIYHCHNWALYTLVEFGVAGVLWLFGYLAYVMVRAGGRLFSARDGTMPAYYGVFSGLLGFMFHNQVDYFLWQSRVNLLFWAMVLLLATMPTKERGADYEYHLVRANQPV